VDQGFRVVNDRPQLDASQPIEGPRSTDIAAADQIDVQCDEFEAAWLRGESPQIETYLECCGESARERLLTDLLLVERELRITHGETASRLDYQLRFPRYSTVINCLEFPTIDDRSHTRSAAIDRSSPPLPGTRFMHFELIEELGSGASGAVWKAKDSRLRRTVAIKIPRQDRLTGVERDRFLREGQACAQLRHPNIVVVHEVGDERGRVFIVAEFIDGLNLRDWMNQRQPNPRQAAELTAELAEALHHAHEHGVIHRDLKPANVLVDSNGRPHVTDFGLAKWTTDTAVMTVEGNILGTPAYMPPEQARGEASQVDRRADVYGLGALLYEMLTGRPPFEGDVAAIVHQVIHDDPCPPHKVASAVPRDLETICVKSMEKSPSRRYPSAQEMGDIVNSCG
jgi:serine/threonine protein kinase